MEEGRDLRARILEAAAALLAERGYEQASMRQIADRIGCSATAIYLHFQGKDDLMFAVVDEGFQRFAAALRAAAGQDGTAEDRLAAVAWAYIDFALAHPTHYRLIFIDKPEFLQVREDDMAPPKAAALNVFRDVVGKVVPTDRGARTLGEFADAMWASVHGVASLACTMPSFDRERALRTADLLIEITTGALMLVSEDRR